MKKILIFEDDLLFAMVTKENIELASDYKVDVEQSGIDSLTKIRACSPDICLIDIMLPGQNGYEIVKEMRENNIDIPVIFVSALTESKDVLVGYKLGCHDYIRKPCDVFELLARVDVALGIHPDHKGFIPRKPVKKTETQNFSDIEFNLSENMIIADGVIYNFTCYESSIIKVFLENLGDTVSYEYLFLKLGRESSKQRKKSFYVTLSVIREKLEPIERICIYTTRKLGIKMVIK